MKKEVREKLNSLEKLDVIVVDWVDAESDCSDEWKDIDIPIGGRIVVAQTVGFYIGHNKNLIRTVSNYDPSNNMGTGRGDIPLTNIKNIATLHCN
tara:strand:- start:1747 stop:2031 length:285 start_codon:yes stop_codon:yes gene_type:complete